MNNEFIMMKKRLSVILVATMVFTLFGGLSFKKPVYAGSEKPTIHVKFMGISKNNEGPADSAKEIPKIEDKDVGKIFWVGVSLSNLSKVDYIKTHGVFGTEIGFEYDPKYVEPCSDLPDGELGGAQADSEEAWLKTVQKFNETDRIWAKADYEIEASSSIKSTDPSQADGREEDVMPGWKMSFVKIEKKDGATGDSKFKGISDNDEHFILKIPFKIKSVPVGPDKPISFKLARGPETLGLYTGEDENSPYQYWEKEDRTVPEVNLKNTFDFGGDINIFTGTAVEPPIGGDKISTMTVKRNYHDAKEDKDKEENVKLHDAVFPAAEPLTEKVFDPAVKKYYIQVKHDTKSIDFTTGGSTAAPTAKLNYKLTPAVADEKSYVAAATGTEKEYRITVPIADLKDVKMDTETGFNNVLTISAEGESYEIYIRKLVEPKIILNYGNSPYGCIERMSAWDEAKKAKARADFDDDYKFTAENTPDGCVTGVKYTPQAWGNPNTMTEVSPGTDLEKWKLNNPEKTPYINYDKDPSIVFAQMSQDIIDRGVTLKDSLDRIVPLNLTNKVVREVYYDQMKTAGIRGFKENVLENQKIVGELDGTQENNVIKMKSVRGRAGLSKIIYKYVDITGTEATAVRCMTILPKLGDVDMNGYVNPVDATLVNKSSKSPLPSEQTVGLEVQGRIFKYRVVDVDKNLYINPVDATSINKAGSVPLKPFYLY